MRITPPDCSWSEFLFFYGKTVKNYLIFIIAAIQLILKSRTGTGILDVLVYKEFQSGPMSHYYDTTHLYYMKIIHFGSYFYMPGGYYLIIYPYSIDTNNVLYVHFYYDLRACRMWVCYLNLSNGRYRKNAISYFQ